MNSVELPFTSKEFREITVNEVNCSGSVYSKGLRHGSALTDAQISLPCFIAISSY